MIELFVSRFGTQAVYIDCRLKLQAPFLRFRKSYDLYMRVRIEIEQCTTKTKSNFGFKKGVKENKGKYEAEQCLQT